ncbi:MAG: WD40 repeat domain-containing protein [Spirochaetaceae bacterium]|nr:MAG: WD40 repeat domain-containing protein [Spirochaetaceae bacterium]
MPGVIDPTPRIEYAIDGYVQEIRWTADSSRVLASSADGEIALFDVRQGHRLWSAAGHELGNASCDITRDGSRVVSCGQDTRVLILDGHTGECVSSAALPAWGERVRFSGDDRQIAVASGKNVLVFDSESFDRADPRPTRILGPHTSTVTDIGYSPVDSETLATTSYGAVTLWNTRTHSEPRVLAWQGSSLVLSWSPDGRFIATGDQDSTVHFWFADSGHDLRMYGFQTKVTQLSWDYSGRYLATGGSDMPSIWDCSGTEGPAETRPIELRFHETVVSCLCFANDRQILASGDSFGNIAIWKPLSSNTPVQVVTAPAGVTGFSFSMDDANLCATLDDGGILIFKTRL